MLDGETYAIGKTRNRVEVGSRVMPICRDASVARQSQSICKGNFRKGGIDDGMYYQQVFRLGRRSGRVEYSLSYNQYRPMARRRVPFGEQRHSRSITMWRSLDNIHFQRANRCSAMRAYAAN